MMIKPEPAPFTDEHSRGLTGSGGAKNAFQKTYVRRWTPPAPPVPVRSRLRVVVSATLLMVFAAMNPVDAQDAETVTVDLRPTWEAGQTSRYEFWNRMTQSADVQLADQSQSQTNTIHVVGEVTWTVNKVKPDGSSSCTMTLDWMSYDMKPSEGPSMAVDSRKPAKAETKPMHELISAMVEVPVTVEVAPDGHVTKIKGLEKMKSKTSQPDFVPSELDFEETASDLASLAYAPAPFDYTPPSGASNKWDAEFRWEHDLGKMDQDWTYRLERVEEIEGMRVAVVSGEGKFDLEVEDQDRPAEAPPVNVKLLEGHATTQVMFDLSRHEAVGRHTTSTEKVRITIPFPDGRKFERTLTEISVGQVLRLSED